MIFNTPKKLEIIRYVNMSCSYLANDPIISNDLTRMIMGSNQFVNDTYRLHCSLLASGNAATEVFRSGNSLKFLMRQIKGADSVIQQRAIKGAASVNKEHKFKEMSAILLTLYGNLFLVSKSYNSSLNYLIRAYKIAPKEPLILLSLGVANLNRALQRQSLNRHSQILQGFSYLLEYRDVRTEDAKVIKRMMEQDFAMGGTEKENHSNYSDILWELQEVHYNLGRSFHTLGLFSLAAHHYNKVLDDFPDTQNFEFNLKVHAAYNLQHIYVISGNSKLSRHYVDKYLVI